MAWPQEWRHPPDPGPFYGVQALGADGTPKGRVLICLISNHGMMTYAMVSVLSGSAYLLVPLTGSPEVILCVKNLQTENQKRFAAFYWEKESEIEAMLHERQTIQGLQSQLSCIFEGIPSGAWSFAQTDQSVKPIRSKAGKESFITCQFESGLSWDSIYALRLSATWSDVFVGGGYRSAPARELDGIDWELDTLANIYTKQGKIVGVLLRKSNFEGCVPRPSYARTCDPPGKEGLFEAYAKIQYTYWAFPQAQTHNE